MDVTNEQENKSPLNQGSQSADLENWAGNWIWRAVQCLVQAPDFNPSPRWIAARLNISLEKALDALEGLERLRFIRREGSSFVHTDQWVQVLPGRLSTDDLLSRHAKIAPRIIAKLEANDKYTTQFLVANKELVSKYAPRFIALYKEMNDEGLRLGHTEVFASEMSFVQLTKDIGGQQ
jgi:hypothetical protein